MNLVAFLINERSKHFTRTQKPSKELCDLIDCMIGKKVLLDNPPY